MNIINIALSPINFIMYPITRIKEKLEHKEMRLEELRVSNNFK